MRIETTFGPSRAEHVGMIEGRNSAWNGYFDLHAAVFAENRHEKYVVVDQDGKVLARNSDKSKLEIVTNATLRHEDYQVIREALVEPRRKALVGIEDLMGLSFGVSIGEEMVGFENYNKFRAAKQEMNPGKGSYVNNDSDFERSYVPNPITHASFQVPMRQGQFDYKSSVGLSETARVVAERLETTLFNGNSDVSISIAGTAYPIYGYTTHPNRGTGTISDWAIIANIDSIIPEMTAELGAMNNEQGGIRNNSVMVYVASDVAAILENDYKAANPTSRTVLERMKMLSKVKDVKESIDLADGEVVLVEMERRTVELAVASDIIVVPHTKTSPFMPTEMTTYAAMVHQIKVDRDDLTGVRHLSK
jgi:hypothetical protein